MKIGEYEQMMSYLTRPKSTTPIQPRENLKYGTVPGKGNSKINFDPEIDTYRKRVQETIDGKKTNKYIYSEPGQSLEDFKKIKPVRSTGADDATVRVRQYVDNWTKNWFDNNLKDYGVKDFDAMIDGLSSDWQLELESGDVPKASGKFNLSTPELNLPNITTLADAKIKPNLTPFKYNDVTFYKNLEGTNSLKNKTLAQFKKVFYKDQINTNPQLREGLNKFFDFMSADKRGLYKKIDGKTIKDFMNTEVSDEVKFLLDPEISGLDKASKKEVFNSYSDFADNYNKFTEDKVRLKAVQAETEAVAKAGEKTAEQYKKVKADIAKQNDVLAKMSVKEIANNKELLNSVRLSINPKTGDVSYTNYTVNDPKGKQALTDLELAEKIKQKAKNKNFYVTEHIGKKSFNKTNLAYPNNIQSANYMSNAQLENARRFLINSENRNTPAAQNLDKTLEDLKLTIRGSEYGGKPIGNKIPIVFDSKTNRSNIVDSQLLNNKTVDALKNQRGFISTELLGAQAMADGIKKYGPAAKQIAKTSLSIPGLSSVFEVPFIPGYQEEGYTPKEIATQMVTGGFGVPFKDIQEKARFVKDKGLGTFLTDAFNKKMISQNIRPALNTPVDFGASQDLTEQEQAALNLYDQDAQEVINTRRKIQADKYKRLEEMEDFEDEMFRDGAMNGGIMKLKNNDE
jgi:hypothetical protein